MRVVIVGAGEVGYHVIGILYREGVEIVAIDTNPSILEQLREEFGIRTIAGNAVDTAVLAEAGVREAELFMAVTNQDETNIIACMMAGEEGVQKTVARVKNIDLGETSSFSDKKRMGIDLVINPYEVAAEHLYNLVLHPQVTDYAPFFSDQLLLLRVPVEAHSPLVGASVLHFGQQAHIPQTLIAVILREGKPFIPTAEEVIRRRDQVYFFCERCQYEKLLSYLGLSMRPARRVYINGGGHIGIALAQRLERLPLDVRVLEISEQQCDWLSQHLNRTLVLHANGSDFRVLQEEGVERSDLFISLTAADPINVVSCMLAKEVGARKTVALVKQPEIIPMLMTNTKIDLAFSPRLLTARKILRFTRGRNLESFFMFPGSDIELLELRIRPGMPCEAGPIAELNLPTGMLIGAIKRGDDIFVPRGQDRVCAGDTLMLLQDHRNRRFSQEFFLQSEGSGTSRTESGAPSLGASAG